ncbi:disulfide bond formation protein B [Neptuniibacter sp. QD37_11]|uniref:disulfide bond formation protein B n=1 Tax=Neptuniibacter sp. QD37_11 TaxID=3398209 RepID=UPI0039F55224
MMLKFALPAITGASLLVGLFLQHVLDMQPCPICIVQRLILISIFIVSALPLLLTNKLVIQCSNIAVAILTVTGLYFSFDHITLISAESFLVLCSAFYEQIIDFTHLNTLLPSMFAVTGSCTDPDSAFLGIPLPYATLVLYLAILPVCYTLVYKEIAHGNK